MKMTDNIKRKKIVFMYDTLAFELVANLEVTSVRVNIILSKEKT